MILGKELYDRRSPLASALRLLKLFVTDIFLMLRRRNIAPDYLLAGKLRGIPQKSVKGKCADCDLCVEVCPTDALAIISEKLYLNIERCIYCEDCINFCPDSRLSPSKKNIFSCHGENKNFILDLELEID